MGREGERKKSGGTFPGQKAYLHNERLLIPGLECISHYAIFKGVVFGVFDDYI